MIRIILFIAVFVLIPCIHGQDWAKQKLENSPRHHEWVEVERGGKKVRSFLVFPEREGKALAVVVIHENRGLTDWVRSVADQLAAAGYIAIAPDLLSGMAPGGGGTKDFESGDAARDALYRLKKEDVMADLDAVADYVSKLPAANGKVTVAGFCWGGSQSFLFANARSQLAAAFVFYGTGPDREEGVEDITCPVYGFYGGNDARVNATIEKTAEVMQKSGKKFEPVTYDGAGHGFMRSGEEPNPQEANKRARDVAWKRWLEILGKI